MALWETIWRRKVSRAASPDSNSMDKASKAASLDNPNRRKVAKVRLKQNRTTRTAIVSVARHSFSTAMFVDHWEVPARPGLHFVPNRWGPRALNRNMTKATPARKQMTANKTLVC
jgi:hypothetical protein